MANEFARAFKNSDVMVKEFGPVLASESPEVVGAALSQMLAMFIAVNAPDRRESVRRLLIECCDLLVPIYVEEMIKAGLTPMPWRGVTETKQ